MNKPTLTPAYGRDYHSAKAAREAFNSGKDFILNDLFTCSTGISGGAAATCKERRGNGAPAIGAAETRCASECAMPGWKCGTQYYRLRAALRYCSFGSASTRGKS